MKEITVDSNPSEALLKEMGAAYWPTWEKEVSVFPWEFVTTETALILEGECEITPADGGPSTTFKISFKSSLKFFPSFATRDGLVVTPSKNPIASASLISSIFAVSIKNFIFISSLNNYMLKFTKYYK